MNSIDVLNIVAGAVAIVLIGGMAYSSHRVRQIDRLLEEAERVREHAAE